ncbi:hypothetical protein YPPY07_0752, partial [Yersinia pestis PY-07]
MSLAQSSQP